MLKYLQCAEDRESGVRGREGKNEIKQPGRGAGKGSDISNGDTFDCVKRNSVIGVLPSTNISTRRMGMILR